MNRIKPTIEDDGLERNCPHCNHPFSLSDLVEKDNKSTPPKPGDVHICKNCALPSEFTNSNRMVPIADTDKFNQVMADEAVIEVREKILSYNQSRYAEQLESMSEAVRSWKSENISLSPSIQYNFPGNVAVISTVQAALNNKFISINDDARKMLDDLGWLTEQRSSPTILMVRAVLEHVFG